MMTTSRKNLKKKFQRIKAKVEIQARSTNLRSSKRISLWVSKVSGQVPKEDQYQLSMTFHNLGLARIRECSHRGIYTREYQVP